MSSTSLPVDSFMKNQVHLKLCAALGKFQEGFRACQAVGLIAGKHSAQKLNNMAR